MGVDGRLLQTKLTISEPGDVYEQEADRVAEQVMRMSPADVSKRQKIGMTQPLVQRRASSSATGLAEAPSSVNDALNSPGQPLDAATRAFFEPRFGTDLSHVRVHSDTKAAGSAQAVNARAYTVGQDVAFGVGQYAPGKLEGKRLLAHELTHVVQQERVSPQNDVLCQSPQRVILRAPSDTTTAVNPSPTRIVYIDANVIDQINRGNTEAAKALLKMRDSGADIRISQQAYNELVVDPPKPQTATAQRLILEEMGIKLGPPTQMSARVAVYHENITRAQSTGPPISEADIRVIAESKAAGEGELWTFDKVARTNPGNVEKPFGIKLAPETTTIAPVNNKGNYKLGRQLLGLDPVEISDTGLVTRAPAGQVVGGETSPIEVQSKVNVTRSIVGSDGSIVSEVEVTFEAIAKVNSATPSGGTIPETIKFRLIQNANGSFVSAEPLTGEPASLVEALGRQIVAEAANVAEGTTAGAAEGAVAAGASRASKALPYVRTGLKWGGPALFVIVTGYQLVTAKPQERPRVLTKAAGGLAGGVGTGFLVCNLLLDLETAGWGILICGLLAGGAGGYAGSEVAGDIYDAANPPPGLTELEQALLKMEHQPSNVKALFYSMISGSGSNGIAITPEFVEQFIFTVPSDLAVDELYLLAGQLQGISNTATLQSVLDSLSHAINQLPRRKVQSTVLPPELNIQDVLELNPSLRYRIDAPSSGTFRIFPGYPDRLIREPGSDRPNVLPLLEIRIPHT